MSFRCELCGTQVPPGIPATTVVLAMRRHHFPRRIGAHTFKPWNPLTRTIGERVTRDDPGGHGLQIAVEARACPDCTELVWPITIL